MSKLYCVIYVCNRCGHEHFTRPTRSCLPDSIEAQQEVVDAGWDLVGQLCLKCNIAMRQMALADLEAKAVSKGNTP